MSLIGNVDQSGPGAPPAQPARPSTTRSSKVWLWFVAAFVIQAAAWAAWFVIASQHKVAEVPLAPTTR